MKHSFMLVTALLFVLQISIANAQTDKNTKVVVIPLLGSDSGSGSGITYVAGSQIAIDSNGDGSVQTIRFAPTNNGIRDNHQPSLGINHIIALQGIFPSRSSIADPTIAEITMFGGNFAPRSWAFCDGQLLSIAQNQALFAIIGTFYGGDGRTTMALPDLRGRTAVHRGSGPGLRPINIGERFGTDNIQL